MPLVLLANLIGVAACGGSADTATSPRQLPAVASVTINAPRSAIRIGETLQLTTTATDASGKAVSGRPVTWESTAPSVASVSSAGLVTALASGETAIRATSEGTQATVTISVTPVPATSITVVPSTSRFRVGASLQLAAQVHDSAGRIVTDRAVTWTSGTPSVATVTPNGPLNGTVTAVAIGSVDIQATIDEAHASVHVDAVSGTAPIISGISPAVLPAGGLATITGSGFGATPAANTVTVGGSPALVQSASPGQLVVRLASAYPCAVTRAVRVAVSSGTEADSVAHPLSVARQVNPALGALDTLKGAASTRCIEVPATGRYAVAVVNTDISANGTLAFTIRGTVGTATSAPGGLRAATTSTPPGRSRGPQRGTLPPRLQELLNQQQREARLYEQDRRIGAALSARVGSAGSRSIVNRPPAASADIITPTEGAISGMHWRSTPDCVQYDVVPVRTVYVGRRVLVVEDTMSPTAGQRDAFLRQLGAEVDGTILDLITSYFGSPFAQDAQLGHTGRLLIAASPRVNRAGIAGAADVCATGPYTTATASNNMPAVGINVPPTSADIAFINSYTWGVLAHELVHVATMAERLSRTSGPNAWDESWLGEGLADLGAVLYNFRICGWTRRSNIRYADITACQARLAAAGRPTYVIGQFWANYDYLAHVEERSPFTSGYTPTALLLDYVLDQSAQRPEDVLHAFVTDVSRVGIANFEARAGRSYADVLSDFAAMLYADDDPDIAAPAPALTLASYNSRDIYSGLNTAGGAAVFPLKVHAEPFSNFDLSVSKLAPGSTLYLGLGAAAGTPAAATQLLELLDASGAASPASARVVIVRVK